MTRTSARHSGSHGPPATRLRSSLEGAPARPDPFAQASEAAARAEAKAWHGGGATVYDGQLDRPGARLDGHRDRGAWRVAERVGQSSRVTRSAATATASETADVSPATCWVTGSPEARAVSTISRTKPRSAPPLSSPSREGRSARRSRSAWACSGRGRDHVERPGRERRLSRSQALAKIETERRMRDLLTEVGLPQPDRVEYGLTCLRLFFEDTKTIVIIDIDQPEDVERPVDADACLD